MKKLSGAFICLLLFTVLSSARIIEVADAGITDKLKAVIAAKNAAAPGGSCPAGTYEFGYNGDYDTGKEDYTCYKSGAANEQGTSVGSPTISSAYVIINAQNENVNWTVTGDIAANMDAEGSLFFSVRQVEGTQINANPIIEFSYGSTEGQDVIRCSFTGTSRIYCFNYGAGQSTYVEAAINTNYRCGYSWHAGNDVHVLDCETSGSVTWDDTGENKDNEQIDTFSNDPDTLTIGDNIYTVSSGDDVRVWDVFLVSGFEGTDPGSL